MPVGQTGVKTYYGLRLGEKLFGPAIQNAKTRTLKDPQMGLRFMHTGRSVWSKTRRMWTAGNNAV